MRLRLKPKIKEWIKKYGVKCILIDYIGLIETSKKFNIREQEVAYLSKFIKNLASELSISVILLAQLNREGEKNPKSSNLAESISIARDSDFVFTIFKPVELGIKELRVNKNSIPLTKITLWLDYRIQGTLNKVGSFFWRCEKVN